MKNLVNGSTWFRIMYDFYLAFPIFPLCISCFPIVYSIKCQDFNKLTYFLVLVHLLLESNDWFWLKWNVMVGEYCVSSKFDLGRDCILSWLLYMLKQEMIYIHTLYITGRWESLREELFSVMEKKLRYLLGKLECYQM